MVEDDLLGLVRATATLRERLAERFDGVWAEGRSLEEDAARELACQQQ